MMVEKKDGVDQMDAVQGMAAVGRGQPVEAVAVGDPLHEFAGGHEGGVDGHDQGEAGQGGHGDAEGDPVDQGGVMGDQVPFVGLKIDGGRQGQGGYQGGDHAHGQGQKDIGTCGSPASS